MKSLVAEPNGNAAQLIATGKNKIFILLNVIVLHLWEGGYKLNNTIIKKKRYTGPLALIYYIKYYNFVNIL